jgi:hypothetical protein
LAGALGIVLALAWMQTATGAGGVPGKGIRLQISPRLCTLAARDKQCDVLVQASWRAPQEESLCLVLLGRPEIKRCWEDYAAGTYTLQLEFAQDLTFQVLRVLREALQYRHRRRQPWNIFD